MGTNAYRVKNHINIQPGSAPSNPTLGDIYCDVSGVFRRWNGTIWEVLGAGGGSGTSVDVSQTAHGFVAADIGKAIRSSGVSGEYTFAMADAANNAEVVGIISDASSGVPNQFSYIAIGPMTGLSGLTTGEVYFLSASASGVATTTEPSVVGQISKPLYVATSATTAIILNSRGTTVGGTNLYSTISLANNATTSFHTIQGDAGTGGWLSGTIKIDATTDYAIPFFCFFSRQLDGTTYNVAASFGSDIPAGLSITNSGSSVQVVMPNLAGFVSASVTYCVQAAANGTTLPVSVSASSVLGSTSGVAPAAGVIGESGTTIGSGSVSAAASGAYKTVLSKALGAGVWLVTCGCRWNDGSSDASEVYFGLSDSADTTPGDGYKTIDLPSNALAKATAGMSRIFVKSSSWTVYLNAGVTYGTIGTGTWDADGSQITYIRIG